MLSTRQKIERLSGMLDTDDLTPWEHDFVFRLSKEFEANKQASITERQSEILDQIHGKHFA